MTCACSTGVGVEISLVNNASNSPNSPRTGSTSSTTLVVAWVVFLGVTGVLTVSFSASAIVSSNSVFLTTSFVSSKSSAVSAFFKASLISFLITL